MRFLVIFILIISTAMATEKPKIKNIVINKELKTYENITFLDIDGNLIRLSDYKGSLILLNFWATWCAPCKKEMPSLDALKENPNLSNLNIFPINISKENSKKSKKFFQDLNIKNLDIYFDNPITLAKKLSLRGIPTTIIFNKNGEEFARIIGSIDFEDEEFLSWIKKYN